MKKYLLTLTACLLLPACANLTPQQAALLTNAVKIANVAAVAAATIYGGPVAGSVASAGLSAIASVMQGYVGTTIPATVIQNSPGLQAVGVAVAKEIAPNKVIDQQTVDLVNRAAAIADTLKAADLVPVPAAVTTK